MEMRFIPARAGNGSTSFNFGKPLPVHPRARGERPGLTSAAVKTTGSSPRARGTACRGAHVAVAIRFIPARAGNGAGARD